MGVKFFCNVCGKEIFQSISEDTKERITLKEAEFACICSDCDMKDILGESTAQRQEGDK